MDKINFLEPQAGDIIHAKKIFTLLRKGKPYTLKSLPATGTIKTVNKDGTITMMNGDIIKNDPSLFTIESSTGSIPHQLARNTQIFVTGNPLSKNIAKGAAVATDVSKKVVTTAKDIGGGIVDATKTTLSVAGFLGRNLNIILILVVIGIGIFYLSNVKRVLT